MNIHQHIHIIHVWFFTVYYARFFEVQKWARFTTRQKTVLSTYPSTSSAVRGMLYAGDAGIVSKLAEGLAKMRTVIVTVFEAAGLTVSEKKE